MIKQSIFIGLTFTLLSGCQVVSVKQQNLATTLSNERDSILTRSKLSEASLNVLAMTGKEAQTCTDEPASCLQILQQIPEILDEQVLSTASEVYLARAIQLKKSVDCNPDLPPLYKPTKEEVIYAKQAYESCSEEQLEALGQSLRYSYAYLFATKRPLSQRLFDNRQVQVRDFYNQALTNLVNTYNDLQGKKAINYADTLHLGKSIYHVDIQDYPKIDATQVEKLFSTYNLGFSGLKSISRRDGFGAEFVIQLRKADDGYTGDYQINPLEKQQSIKDNPNLHEARFLPATLVFEPENTDSVDAILHSKNLKLRLINPNHLDKVSIANKDFPLAANFSAPYGLWLANTNLGAAAYWALLDREQNMIMPHLFMLEPYNPDKKVIIMIHGLASSPEAWIAMTNDIMSDATLRDNFQVWQIFYSTNMPIMESRYQIYALLKQTFDDLNQQYPTQPIQHSVLLGHSMGGVISRMLVSNKDYSEEVLQHLQKNHLRKYEEHKRENENFGKLAQQRLQLHTLYPPIDRAIFVASPFRGTDYADRWFTLAARKIIKLPQGFLNATLDTVSHGLSGDFTSDYLTKMAKEFLQNGPSDLSKKSAFMQITAETPISNQVKYHVIIGNDTKFADTEINKITDGIVPYSSAHLDGAESEKIIKGGHSIQYSPEAVLELRRILRLHLQEIQQK